MTAGLLEKTLGRNDAARAHLSEAAELGGHFGNHWLESAARTQLASLLMTDGHLDEARALLFKSVHASEDAELSTQAVTFALVADAQLALAEGDVRHAALALGAAEGLRQRAGLKAWPSTRRGEAELVARVAGMLDPKAFKEVFETGSRLNRRDAVSLVSTPREASASD